MASNGFYERLRKLARNGQWRNALGLMRASDLPTLKRAFRITAVSSGRYEMVFSFSSLDEMHTADREWHEFRRATDEPVSA